MTQTDLDRIIEDASRPRIVALHFALARLGSCVSFMNTGAHPDDETSAMLAVLGFRDGLDISYACANRGEGGQNDIGTEASAVLGMLRTAEMERAAERLDLRLYWLSEHPDDSLLDFGFSKSGPETLERWNRQRTLRRFVEIVRNERPDILCPTFLDVPGQHGHHRAMTEAAHEIMDLAGDPAFETPGLMPWQPKKLFLPAWGGGGSAYDDEQPPPPATLVITGRGIDPLSGWSYERIGQQSRRFHATQGMGRWIRAGTERDWPLHLVCSSLDTASGPGLHADGRHARGVAVGELDQNGHDASLLSGLPATLADLAEFAGAHTIGDALATAQASVEAACAEPLAFGKVLTSATRALRAIRDARAACPPAARAEVDHRLARKEQQLARVIRLAAGVDVRGRVADARLRPGESTALEIEVRAGHADVAVTPLLDDAWILGSEAGDGASEGVRNGLRAGVAEGASESVSNGLHAGVTEGAIDGVSNSAREGVTEGVSERWQLALSASATPSDPYPSMWRPDDPPMPALEIVIDACGERSSTRIALEHTPLALAARSAEVEPSGVLVNLATASRAVCVAIRNTVPDRGVLAFDVPEDWQQRSVENGCELIAPDALEPGLFDLPLKIDGKVAFDERHTDYPHVPPRVLARPASVHVRALSIELPTARIGYVGGGNDRVAHWLRAMGLDVRELGSGSLAEASVLAGIDTLVVGLFAMRTRPDLAAAMPMVHAWVEEGGHLLTLYHRPWDGWSPDAIPPKWLEIGQPSLRFRVTDEQAAVTHLMPSHALLSSPNRIDDADWRGWHKERGLYFAKSWDDAYVPLLSMADPGEKPHTGALLSAEIGDGRHTHTSLILHHQMERLVPGAFRLMANLVA